MKKILILFVITFAFFIKTNAQHFTNLNQDFLASHVDIECIDMAVAKDKSFYLLYENNASCCKRIYLSKLDSNANVIWSKNITGDRVYPKSLALDKNDNIYISGWQIGGYLNYDTSSFGFYNIYQGDFMLSINKNGGLRFFFEAPAGDLTVDSSLNLYITNQNATFKFNSLHQVVWTDSSLAGTQIKHFSSNIIYVLGDSLFRINKSGMKLWKRPLLGAKTFEIDKNGSIYLLSKTNLLKRISNGNTTFVFPEGGKDIAIDANSNFTILKDSEMVNVNFNGSQVMGRTRFVANFNMIEYVGNRISCSGEVDCFSNNQMNKPSFLPPYSLISKNAEDAISAIFDFNTNVYKIAPEYFYNNIYYWCNVTGFGAGIGNVNTPCVSTPYFFEFRTNREFNQGNIFSVQLSDKNGSFNNPTIIGAIAAQNGNQPISITFPKSIQEGTNYKLRILSTNPAIISDYNGLPFPFYRPAQTVVSAQNNDTAFCASENALIRTLVNPNFSHTYFCQWYRNGIAIVNATDTFYKPTLSGNYNIVASWQTCTLPSDNQLNITTFSKPNATITPAVSTICDTVPINLIANTGNGLNYKWYKNNFIINGATASNYTASDSGKYKVTVTNTKGCSRTSNIVSVNQFKANLTPLGSTTFCNGSNVILSTDYNAIYMYQWIKNNNDLLGQTANLYNATTAGIYKVRVSNNTGCTITTSSITVTIPCRDGNNIAEETIAIYPTVFSDNIILDLDESTKVNVSIIDALGKCVYNKSDVSGPCSIPTANMPQGLYIVMVKNANINFTKRLIKE